MSNLDRFTNPASGTGIKKLLKDLQEKGAQLRNVLWLEDKTDVDGCACCGDDVCECESPEDFDPCQFELTIRNNVVFSELSEEQVLEVLPLVKKWIIGDLEALERSLNQQGVYLEGQEPAAPAVNLTPRLKEGDVCVVMKGSYPNLRQDSHVEVTRYYPGELFDYVDVTVIGTNHSANIKANHLRRLIKPGV